MGRNGQIWQACLAGNTQEAIAEMFGLTQARISEIIGDVRASIPAPVIADIAQIEADRIALLYVESMRIMRSSHPLVSMQRGTVVRDEDTGLPFEDDGPRLAAINMALKIHERVAKTYGTDAATKMETTSQVRFTIEGVDTGDV